jgi:RNA polymerase sigma-70 factor (ECF subfamily)
LTGGENVTIDVQLIKKAKDGIRTALPDLRAGSFHLYKFALYTLENPHDAEDVVSETFIEAYKESATCGKKHCLKRGSSRSSIFGASAKSKPT